MAYNSDVAKTTHDTINVYLMTMVPMSSCCVVE